MSVSKTFTHVQEEKKVMSLRHSAYIPSSVKSPLTKEELKSHQDANVCYICGKSILRKPTKSKNYRKLEIIAIIQVNTEVQHIVFVI